MKTSQKSMGLGLYASACCGAELIFDRGDILVSCPDCEFMCEWNLVESLVSWADLEMEIAA